MAAVVAIMMHCNSATRPVRGHGTGGAGFPRESGALFGSLLRGKGETAHQL